METLKHSVVCITGASSGIGASCAGAFAAAGASLCIFARRKERLDALAARLTATFGTRVYTAALDVRDRAQVDRVFSSLPDEWRQIDILLNNAGLASGFHKLHEGVVEDWEEMIDTNIKGLLYVSRAVTPFMVARGRGDIVNIGSIAGHEVYPGGNVYCATKFAVDAITKGMQIDLVDTPIRVCTVDPGMAETEFSMVRFHGDTERAQKVYEGITPLSGEDIAEAVLFCVTRPAHVNIHQVRIMPTNQAGAMVAYRRT
jgi:serine 3-dehydrogenase